MNILSEQQYILLPPEQSENYREVWMYQSPNNGKWHIYDETSSFLNFQEYEFFMLYQKDRVVKSIYIEKAEPKEGDTIAVYFSCGAASAIAVKRTLEKYGSKCRVLVVNNPVKEEDEDNQRFLSDVADWLGIKIEKAINSKYPSCSCIEVWDDKQYMSGVGGAPCTLILKKQARYEWEVKNRPDWTVMGFTKEEKGRFDNFQINERPAALYVLENITKADCFIELMEAGIRIPRSYTEFGMPNANCFGCVKATSATYWNHIRKVKPEVFRERAEQSREIGAKLVRWNGKRLFLDELPVEAKGRPLKSMDFECGIFCAK